MAGNEVTVTVSGGTTTTVTVPGSTGTPAPTITNGGTANVTVTSVGDRGPQGDVGPATTLTIGTVTGGATAAATLTGPAGAQVLNLTLPQGATGANVELQSTATHLQWRPVGGTTWTNLVALTAITGPQGSTGAAGSNIELQTTSTHIQWRVVGGTTWTNLVALTAITGPQGSTGATGPAGPANSLTVGTITTGAAGSSASATITGTAPNQTLSLTIPRGDKGQDGADVEFQSSSTHLQWRYAGGSTWADLVALSAITGPQGNAGPQGSTGATGSNIELQTTSTHIQWRLVGDSTWTDLVALTAITGPQGPQGPQGPSGSGGVAWQTPPDSPSSSGTAGDIAYDSSFFYVRTSAGWRRTALSSWVVATDPFFSDVSLLLHLNGADGSTTFTDSSGTPKSVMRVNGTTISTAESRFGGASGLFNGNGRYLEVAHSAAFSFGTGDFTIEAWVRLAATGKEQAIAAKWWSPEFDWLFFVDSSNRLRLMSNPGGDIFGGSLSSGVWYHVAASRGSGTARLFLDGALVASQSSSHNFSSSAVLQIGQSQTYWSLDGHIDDVRITKGVARYTAAFTPPTAPFPDA
jgi:hypothetical protein